PEVLFDGLRPSVSEFDIAPGQPLKLVSTALNDPLKTELNAVQYPVQALKRAAEPPKRSGQVAVFVSRKEKKIFVRREFVPLFDMPIEIEKPDQPLGTHLFTALELEPDGSHMRWNAVTIPSGQDSTSDRIQRFNKK